MEHECHGQYKNHVLLTSFQNPMQFELRLFSECNETPPTNRRPTRMVRERAANWSGLKRERSLYSKADDFHRQTIATRYVCSSPLNACPIATFVLSTRAYILRLGFSSFAFLFMRFFCLSVVSCIYSLVN